MKELDETGSASEKEQKEAAREEKVKRPLWRELLSLLGYLAVVLVLTYLVLNYVGVRTGVQGTSMNPTLSNGDQLIVEKVSYYFREPERFDIIVFPYPVEPSMHYIKRIIGLPGETVQIIDGYVYINGELLDEHYGNAVMSNAGVAKDPIVLGPDEYFVLGDNRNNSEDSRYAAVGNIKRDQIFGRAWVRIWPFDSIGVLKHQ